MVEDEFAVRAGRAEAGVAAGSLDLMGLFAHGRSLLGTKDFFCFLGIKERDDIVDAADAFLEGSNELFCLVFFLGRADRSKIFLGDVLKAGINARCFGNTLDMCEYFFLSDEIMMCITLLQHKHNTDTGRSQWS
ncbi:MAG: hypothetical protein ACFWTM_07990 [Mitsuokella multacida]